MGFLAVLFALAGSVWLIPALREGRILKAVALLLITGTVFGPPFFAVDGPVQISLDRVLWGGILALVVVRWKLGHVSIPKVTRVDLCLLALVAYLFLSSRGGDLVETRIDPTARWLFYIFMPVVTYFVCRSANIREKDFRFFLHAIIGLGVYLSLTAVCEVKGLHALVFPKFILDPDVWEFYGRGRGPLLNPAGNGFVIGVAMAAVATFLIQARGRVKAAYLLVGLVLLLGGYATLTRSCWLGIVGAPMIIAMVHSPRWLRVLGLAAAVLLAGAMTMGLKEQLLALKRDKELSAVEAAKSIELRPLLAVVAWEMFKDKPITGHGFGQYFQHSDGYHTVRGYEMPLERVRSYSHHNVFLAFLVDSGLIGFSLFASVLVMLFFYGWRMATDGDGGIARREAGWFAVAVVAAYLPNAMFHDMTIIPMVQMFLMCTAGVTVTIYQNGFERSDARHPAGTPAGIPVTQPAALA